MSRYTTWCLLLLTAGVNVSATTISINESTANYTIPNLTGIVSGRLQLCETFGAAPPATGPCTSLDLTSDELNFIVSPSVPNELLINYISDALPPDENADSGTFNNGTVPNTVHVSESLIPLGDELITYAPTANQPGFALDANNAPITYSIRSDAPEPSSAFLLLVGAGLLILGTRVLHRKQLTHSRG